MTVEDMLARRTRLLFLDAKASCEAAQKVAVVMAKELGEDQDWINQQLTAYYLVAKNYMPVQN
jgi:glycerol-3-phosphate dehydrogenase